MFNFIEERKKKSIGSYNKVLYIHGSKGIPIYCFFDLISKLISHKLLENYVMDYFFKRIN
jgi:hypothetical protein